MKKILIVWIAVAVILVTTLTIIGFKITSQNKPYKELENYMKKQAESLIGENPSILTTANQKLTITDFVNNNYNLALVVGSDKCDAYVIVEKNMAFYKYTPYIKCANYTTKGYEN